ncbi:MAG: hypothetical protein JRN34_00890 [Nitrososphaerota archaeon]|nr:hypothetical protein [Nitrososphaerota archaeon]MDG6941469.1 hypothetical protein [Nitrososphaerota archaeon]
MINSIKCPNCGAPYKGAVLSWVDFVKCTYCGSNIKVPRNAPTVIVATQGVAQLEPVKKAFSRDGFSKYLLMKKGVKSFDSISGTLILNNRSVIVDDAGTVSGENPLRGMVERWIAEFMTS